MISGRPALAQVAAVFGTFAAGPLIGAALAHWLAPASFVVEAVSTFALPLAWLAGFCAWFGLGLGHAIGLALLRLLRREARGPEAGRAPDIPAGYGAFVPLSILAGVLAGTVSGVFGSRHFLAALGAWTAAGSLYGLALRALARHGWLPFPEPE